MKERFGAVLCVAALVMLSRPCLMASTVSVGAISVSTIAGGAASSNGIVLSSPTFLISGASLTLRGAEGWISAESSITASAFFGDGSHLAGMNSIAIVATQTFAGSATFLSSFTVRSGGRQIILSTSSVTSSLAISTVGVISFYPELHNSSSTYIPEATTTNTTLGPCVNGSTLTITTTGGKVEAEFSAWITNGGAPPSTHSVVGILQDGQFVDGMSAAKGLLKSRENTSPSFMNTFAYLFTAPSPGVHSYCITLATPDGGAATLINRSDFSAANFFLKEIK